MGGKKPKTILCALDYDEDWSSGSWLSLTPLVYFLDSPSIVYHSWNLSYWSENMAFQNYYPLAYTYIST